ncbi:MAG TPA: hypothetical protein VH678_14975 [Xanthobacteraceae bacterium]|jgi:hypothetical protein
MLTTLLGWLAPNIVDSLLGRIQSIFQAYFNKQISAEQLREQMVAALLASFAEVEKAYADALSKTFAAFMGAMQASRLVRVVWASVVVSELLVLLWHQVGIPAIVALGWISKYPSSGTTVECGANVLRHVRRHARSLDGR